MIGVPSELTEEEVLAIVVAKPGHTLTPEDLLDHGQDRLPHFAVPRYVRFTDELPKTPSQRIEKFRLREIGLTRRHVGQGSQRLRGQEVTDVSVPIGYRRTPDAPRTIGDFVRAAAAANGDRVAVEVVGRPKTYAAIDQDTDRVATGLIGLGLDTGDNVALMMENSIENIDAWFGLTKAGLLEVPINTANRGDLLQYLVDQSGRRALVIDEEYLDRLAAVAADLPGLEHVIVPRRLRSRPRRRSSSRAASPSTTCRSSMSTASRPGPSCGPATRR